MVNNENNRSKVDKNNNGTITINDVLHEKKYLDIRIIIICTTLITFLTWAPNSFSISCMLSIFQNVIMVFIITSMLLSRSNTFSFTNRIKRGVIVGSVIGGIYAIVLYIVENIEYYFFGVREITYSAIGIPIPPLNIYTIRGELCSGLWAIIFLVILSAIIGFIAGLLPGKPRFNIDFKN
ncbi:MAG: hypothetical protein A2136_07660 [Chloroflexi bacterium RBG_16_54_11]|nr:MAG: hypothetical protein A2136_07660 [Chloroflexi bacterium RBG_16_54_11]